MESISEDQFDELLNDFQREAVHLETRDAYGTKAELSYMAKWAKGSRTIFTGWTTGAPPCAGMWQPVGRCVGQ